MKYPNLYIVGAPKSGTTSLYHFLEQHPEISIPNKEPRFFIRDSILKVSDEDPIKPYLLRSSVLDLNDYCQLYNNKTEKILCDASTQYLYHHQEVIPKIKDLEGPEPKILILLRNPIDRAFSNYQHNLSTYETLSFEQAIKNEPQRIGQHFNSFWHYIGLSTYASQVKAYLDNFSNVKVVFFENFINDIDHSLKDIFEFLEVDTSIKTSSFMINTKSTGTPKSLGFNKMMNKISSIGTLKSIFYNLIGQKRTQLIKEIIMRKNLTKSKVVLNQNTRYELETFFIEDISKLKEILPIQNVSWLNDGKKS